MGSYCAWALSWPPPELSFRGAGQKDRSSGEENDATVIVTEANFGQPLSNDELFATLEGGMACTSPPKAIQSRTDQLSI